MVTESNIRYIVVLFYQGIGYTLQTDNKPHVFFERSAKSFKTIGRAIKAANKVSMEYRHDTACIFKVRANERLSCDTYQKWFKDESRVALKIYNPTC